MERTRVAWGTVVGSFLFTLVTNADRIAKFFGIVNIPKDAGELMMKLSEVPTLASWIIAGVGVVALSYLFAEQVVAAARPALAFIRSWEFRSPFIRKGTATVSRSRPNAPVAPVIEESNAEILTPIQTAHGSQMHLTPEQEHFRRDLRKCVTRLSTAYKALRLVIDRAVQVGASHSELTFLATQCVGFMRPNIGELENMAQVDITKMDQNGLQVGVIEFQRHNYGEAQTVLNRLCAGLRRYGVTLGRAELDRSQELARWLEADAECLRSFRDLCTSPEAHQGLRREKYFGTIDTNRWGGTNLV